MLQCGVYQTGLILLISLMLCVSSLCFTEPKHVRRGEDEYFSVEFDLPLVYLVLPTL